MASSTLPLPNGPSQPYWDVSVLDTAHVRVPLVYFIDPLPAPTSTNPDPDPRPLMPALCFLLRHSDSPTRTPTLFDSSVAPSAMSPSGTDSCPYPPYVLNNVVPKFGPLHIPLSVPEALAKGGMHTDDIEHVILSHLHWDHVGDPSWFRRANFVVGDGSKALLNTGYPHNPDSQFRADLLPDDRTTFLPNAEDWKPLGPFPHAYDYFGDGSLYIIDAPGHLPGHINVLARIAPTPISTNNWVYLAGDAAHHCHLLTGEAKMVVERDAETGKVVRCAHEDPEAAQTQIDRMRALRSMDGVDGVGVKVMLAHDGEWYEKNKGGDMFWPGKL